LIILRLVQQERRFAVHERGHGALADLERLFDFLADHNPKLARERMLSVRRAFELFPDHPLLGRQAEDGRRELILSRGRLGYVAKYRWVPTEDVVLILAVRHQLEAGYREE
jgi:plasmid stabilization system protein ParE